MLLLPYDCCRPRHVASDVVSSNNSAGAAAAALYITVRPGHLSQPQRQLPVRPLPVFVAHRGSACEQLQLNRKFSTCKK
jgi:hypothetical protein